MDKGGFRYNNNYNSLLGSGRKCEFCMRGDGLMPIRHPYNYFDKGIGGYFGNPNFGGNIGLQQSLASRLAQKGYNLYNTMI